MTPQYSPLARRAPRRGLEGMTLVEIMIVVIIMALLATAVGVAVLPRLQKARIETAKTDAQALRSAAVMFYSENPTTECPTMDDLVEGGFIDRNRRTTDPWDKEFVIECEGDEISVVSGGPDGEVGTEDDIL